MLALKGSNFMYRLDTAVWEITLKCNIKCIHCGSSADFNKRPKELDTEGALDLVEQLADLGCKRVVLSGGEPFLRKDWAIIAMRIKDLGMRVSFISNGYLVDKDVIDLLKIIEPSGISFSLDGSNEKTHDFIRGKKGVFKRCLNALRETSNLGLYSSAVTSVHKLNKDELEGILDILLECGVCAWQIQIATPQGRMSKDLTLNEEEYYELCEFIAKNREKYQNLINIVEADCIGYYSILSEKFEQKVWHGCQAGLRVIGIESDGSIKGCLSIHGDEFIEGNIKNQSLKDIWNSKDNFKYNRRFKIEDLKGICKDCKYGAVCRAGCSEKALSFTGSIFSSPYCLYNTELKKGIQQ
ncbi:radical SAM protein [bacterium]|nr:radical SAM protein [bacterium]